ncbi:gliding motility protein RemB [Polaribacter aquimarinus]|uniref:Gliding motility protein RemB n=1 Tax=Polaribacter aquimarinus TaxID=2100726 RepID=A0A2U2JBQ8_9FLAO|nr:gliding motility protein RemB [Polaribacter aquimarinus]PWG05776.1 gliding motility protein RemB [Polaribacter aquimarinus]
MIKRYLLLVLLFPSILFSQIERFPVFDVCKGSEIESLENCFLSTTKKHFFADFKVPPIVENENFVGTIKVVFVVTAKGDFEVIFVNTPYNEIKNEAKRVFKNFPRITPGWYNNHATEMKFVLPVRFPITTNASKLNITREDKAIDKKENLLDVVEKSRIADSTFLEHNSHLNIPFTHQRYVDYEFAMHKVSGTHTASKPYTYNEVKEYYNITKEKKKFLKPNKRTWVGNKIWNEHLVQVKKKDYWLTIDFLLDTQLGKDNSNLAYTFNNTRALNVNGAIGKNFSFSTTYYESQGRFASYINSFIENPALNVRPKNSEGLVPGRGKSKRHRTDSHDYPVAEGYLAYTPNKYLQFQFGNGKNFIGDGYRSFVLSDVSSPTTYLKLKANIWKFQYTNIWMWNTEPSITSISDPNEHARKYIATHYLSINISKRLNLGFFETAISAGESGFDAGFLNPLIFYRSLEFNRGEDAGNAILGLTGKYKLNDNISLYSQLMVDEFSFNKLNSLGRWENKFAIQLGTKYFDAFKVKNLFLQLEYNYARPYTFAHKSPILNYGNYSQPMGHLWGANFWEAVAIARYKKDRWSGAAKIIIGKKGFDLQDQVVSYGGDIYQSYNIRFSDTDNVLAQGNTANIFIADVNANYLVNPSNNTNLFASLSYRNFTPNTSLIGYPKGTNVWFSVGIKADLFNWYFDF